MTLTQNSKVRLKAINTLKNTKTFYINNNLDGINISGNIQTLSAGDDYKNQQNKATYCKSLFQSKGSFTLGSATLTPKCYSNVFADCNNLTSIPEGLLPVTTLSYNCYEYMFANCNIEYTPILPAENLADDCYKYMFRFCDKLSSVSFGEKTIG